mmetsp:Transcript_41406/g.117153  ORF Transcript_41406/g.117153 Transcript_41406/m.117153 type:complete len:393 (-) Transcript_41406:70-1248(-)
MALRTLILAASGSAAAIASLSPYVENCASSDSPSLLQVGQAKDANIGWKRSAKDDEDPYATLVGKAVDWAPHPSYANAQAQIFGEVWITASKGLTPFTQNHRLAWRLLDVDSACTKGPGSASRSCAVRIERGNVCKGEEAEPIYSTDARRVNPWNFVSYTSLKQEIATETTTTSLEPVLASVRQQYTPYSSKLSVRVETGLPADAMKNGTVVVYDFAGAPMACSPIVECDYRASAQPMFKPTSNSLQAKHFVPYSEYAGTLDVWGFVNVYEVLGQDIPLLGHYLNWELEGVDPRCDRGPGAGQAKSCSVRITMSTSCSQPNEDPFYKPAERASNPWDDVSYTAVYGRHVVVAKSLGVPVLTGMDSPDAMDQTVIVYDYDGNPTACAVLDMHT